MIDGSDADPLGIGLMQQASNRRLLKRNTDASTMNAGEWNNRPIDNVLPFPQWDGFFQALQNKGVTKLAGNDVGVKRGMWSDTGNGMLAGGGNEGLASIEALMQTINAARDGGYLKSGQ